MKVRDSVRKQPATRQSVSVVQVQKYQDAYGLKITDAPTTDDLLVRHVVWLVEDWRDLFGERRIRWSTLLTAIAGDLATQDLRLLDDPYVSEADYRTAAEWRLMYALNHLADSGLSVVRMRPRP